MAAPFDDDPRNDHLHLASISLRFSEHDKAALRRLTTDELATQVSAREALVDYLVEMRNTIIEDIQGTDDTARIPRHTVSGALTFAQMLKTNITSEVITRRIEEIGG
jgi:hypothetical protein